MSAGGIMYIVGQLGYGGQEKQLWCLVRKLVERGIVPDILVWNYDPTDPYVPLFEGLGVSIWHFGERARQPKKLVTLAAIARTIRPGVIHSYSLYTNIAAHLAAKVTGAAALGSVRSNFLREKRDTGLVLWSLSGRFPEWQIYNSYRAYFNAKNAELPFVPKRIFVIRNGVDLDEFRPLAWPEGLPLRVLGVGSLIEIKNWGLLVDACAALGKRDVLAEAAIIGEGGERERLENKIDALGVGNRVRLLGKRGDIRPEMERCAFLVHVSNGEGCPNVIMEAMACGRAVVCTDAGDSRHIVVDGDTGFVVPKNDIGALVDRMGRLASDAELCRRMGERGRAKAEREFGLDRLVDETLHVYSLAGWNPGQPCAE